MDGAAVPARQRPTKPPPTTFKYFAATAPQEADVVEAAAPEVKAVRRRRVREDEVRSPLLFKQTLSWLQLEGAPPITDH